MDVHTIEKHSVQQFDKWAEDYDKKRYFTFYNTNKALVKVLNPQAGSSILDIGCGTGILLDQLISLKRDLKLFGIDISPEMINVSKEKLGKQINLQIGSANKLPYKNNSFDYVTCSTSFHHHPSSKNSLDEMYRVLKPGGTLVLLDLHTDGILRKILCKLDNIISNEGKTFLFTRKEMANLFRKTGFKNIHQKTCMYFSLITSGTK